MTDPTFLWALYFAQIAGINHHPGSGTKEHKKLTLEECADLADSMLAITKLRREDLWPSEH